MTKIPARPSTTRYQRQLEMLQKVRRGVADVATSRKRVELQMNQLQQQPTSSSSRPEGALEPAARTSPARR